MEHKNINELFDFIKNSPVSYFAIANIERELKKAGFGKLEETVRWNMEKGGKYYVVRNDSSIIAVNIPQNEAKGIRIVASHSDSPGFKVKENAEMKQECYVKLNTEKYGGMILHTWLDRPLSIAGRLAVKENGRISSKLVNIDKDLLVIPNLAIHLNRDANKGVELNAQKDMLPLFADDGDTTLVGKLAEYAQIDKDNIISHDLFLYTRETGHIVGANDEFMMAPRLDDLQCAYSSMKAFVESNNEEYIIVCAVFDNEEVGSSTRQGADSTFLEDVFVRMKEALNKDDQWLRQMYANSFLLSADNAHALHPNAPEKSDPTNKPVLNRGIVLKFHGNQKYTSDALTGAVVKSLGKMADCPIQTYTNRSDIPGGSTLGNISMTHVSIPSADIGFPQLAMHSAVETAGVRDMEYMMRLLKKFYEVEDLYQVDSE